MGTKTWSEKVWANIGRLSVFVTLIGGIIYVYSFITAPSGKLVAEVEFSNFKWPPGTQQLIRDNYYKNSIPDIGSLYNIDGIWFVKIRNAGKVQCSAVNIKLPRAILASVEREGVDPITSDVKGVVSIGNLMPQEVINITAWISGLSLTEKVQISYDKGVGKVILKKVVGPFWWLLAENWWVGIFFFLLLVSIYSIYLDINSKRHRRRA